MMAYQYLFADCFKWLSTQPESSIDAVVTDPPYGVVEYTKTELEKKQKGSGGIWRIPPTIEGNKRSPLPRFSVLNDDPIAKKILYYFFLDWGKLLFPRLKPGAHIFIASTSLLSDILSISLRMAGFERRGEIIRTIMTLRGGDRPKGAETEFQEISVIPRGTWEPWLIFRKPISEKTIAENLRKWGTGAIRRPAPDKPFLDFFESGRTSKIEREIAPHPSLKPQNFLRYIVHASLPIGEGIILDPFAGSGSTLAAAENQGLDSIGLEINRDFFEIGIEAIPKLAKLTTS